MLLEFYLFLCSPRSGLSGSDLERRTAADPDPRDQHLPLILLYWRSPVEQTVAGHLIVM